MGRSAAARLVALLRLLEALPAEVQKAELRSASSDIVRTSSQTEEQEVRSGSKVCVCIGLDRMKGRMGHRLIDPADHETGFANFAADFCQWPTPCGDLERLPTFDPYFGGLLLREVVVGTVQLPIHRRVVR